MLLQRVNAMTNLHHPKFWAGENEMVNTLYYINLDCILLLSRLLYNSYLQISTNGVNEPQRAPLMEHPEIDLGWNNQINVKGIAIYPGS